MDKNEISFENLPKAVAHLANEIAEIKSLVTRTPEVEVKRVPIGIEEACKIIRKAKPTIYTLVRKRLLPCYKNGKKLYFFEDELLDWIKNGRRKTLKEINNESQDFITKKSRKYHHQQTS